MVRVTTYFLDSKRFGCELGDSSGQQVWEALCILVALTAWQSHWMKRKVALTLKSDNHSALTVASQLKARRNRTLIAKELSLLYSESSYEPSFYTHIPGVTNVLSDSLSRLWDPSKSDKVPKQLLSIPETKVARRDDGHFQSLHPRGGKRDE